MALRAPPCRSHPAFDGCKLVHKSCNSFSSCSAEFPPRFSGLLPVAWLRRFLVNCTALCSALPFVQAQRGSCCPGICHVLVVNRSEETALQQAGVPPEWQGGSKVRQNHKGTELIYATRQNSSFSPVSFQRRNQYIEMVGSLRALEMFLDAIPSLPGDCRRLKDRQLAFHKHHQDRQQDVTGKRLKVQAIV